MVYLKQIDHVVDYDIKLLIYGFNNLLISVSNLS